VTLVFFGPECYNKCSGAAVVEGRAREEDLTLDEQACVDCCASKFLEVRHDLVLACIAFLGAFHFRDHTMHMLH
jgi:hypothetical protein